MNSRQKQKVISILENEILDYGRELTTRLPILKELQKDFDAQRHKVEELQKFITENKEAISELIGAKATIRKETHKQKRAYRWMKETRKVLEEKKQFMTIHEVVALLLSDHPENKQSSYSFLQNYKRTFETKNPSFLEYEGKIGLPEWFLNDRPLPKFLTNFMYATGKAS